MSEDSKVNEASQATENVGSEEHRDGLTVVGIGASAGGLEALSQLIANLKPSAEVCYIIAQHLSATYRSMLVNLLLKVSPMPVVEAQDGDVPQENQIYVCPPNKNIVLTPSGSIQLLDLIEGHRGPKPSIDLLFESIANVKGARSVGIILSGTGSDGARGIRFIKAEAGFTFVQEPSSAKYDGMPNAAIGTSKVDFILEPSEISRELSEVLLYPLKQKEELTAEDKEEVAYRLIVERLTKYTNVDFALYKSASLGRRIDRRMAALRIATLRDYNTYLDQEPSEIDNLYKNILIGVTEFFRDSKVFELLKEALTERLKTKQEKSLRVWAPGASTGEEAYTLAMIIHEAMEDLDDQFRVKIFATDIDDDALTIARKAAYHESAINYASDEQRQRYFEIKGDQYKVKKELRDMVVFSHHNIAVDPPFLRLDLVVCRNLLIYFKTQLQDQLFATFHYALERDGLLLLGKSETVGSYSNYFAAIDAKRRLYRSIFVGGHRSTRERARSQPKRFDMVELSAPTTPPINKLQRIFLEKTQEFISPLCVLINEAQDIIFSGARNPYVSRPVGVQSNNLVKNIHTDLLTEFRVAYQQAHKDKVVVKARYQKIRLFDDQFRFVRVVVVPLEITDDVDENMTLVCFQEESLDDPAFAINLSPESNNDKFIEQLEVELQRTKNQLQTLVEELETSNEELQSLNEELQSANEELQSTNEELETTNEELQSTNEELQTAYSELRQSFVDQEKHATELSQTKEALEKVNQQYLRAQYIAKIGHFEWDMVKNEMSWSPYLADLFGIDIEICRPSWKLLRDRVEPKDKALLEKLIATPMNEGSIDMEYRIKMDDGSLKIVHGLLDYQHGKAIRMTGTIKNADERNQHPGFED